MSKCRDHIDQQLPHSRVVVHNQNRDRGSGLIKTRFAPALRDGTRIDLGTSQKQVNRRADADPALNTRSASRPPRDTEYLAQPETCAFPRSFGGEEGVESASATSGSIPD